MFLSSFFFEAYGSQFANHLCHTKLEIPSRQVSSASPVPNRAPVRPRRPCAAGPASAPPRSRWRRSAAGTRSARAPPRDMRPLGLSGTDEKCGRDRDGFELCCFPGGLASGTKIRGKGYSAFSSRPLVGWIWWLGSNSWLL